MHNLVVILVLLITSAQAQSQKFQKWVSDTVQEHRISRMEELLVRLPEEFRRNFTLVHTGRALLETSYENPAVIMFGKDAKVLLSFNGHPAQKGYSSLDLLEFDEKLRGYRPVRFLFSPSRQVLQGVSRLEKIPQSSVFIEKNPKVCASCHGLDHHPIFESSYPKWEGFYGSHRDEITPYQKEERQGLKALKERIKHSPRYQALIFPDESYSTATPFMDESTEKLLPLFESLRYRPNLFFGAYLVRNNAQTLYRQLSSAKDFPKFKHLLAFSLEGCDFALFGSQLNKLQEVMSKLPWFQSYSLGSSDFFDNEMILNRQLGAQILQLLGVKTESWNLALVKNNPESVYHYWSGYGGSKDFVLSLLARHLSEETQELEYKEVPPIPGSLENSSYAQALSNLGKILRARDHDKNCHILKGEIERALLN